MMFRLFLLFTGLFFATCGVANEAKAPALREFDVIISGGGMGPTAVSVPESWVNLDGVRHVSCGTGMGTGSIIRKNIILTAAHVVDTNKTCIDTLSGAIGQVVLIDPAADIALLQFEPKALPDAIIRISCEGFHREEVYVSMGWMLGKAFILQRMLGTGYKVLKTTTNQGTEFYNLDLLAGVIVPGMSGGPIINQRGEMVGTNQTTDWNGVDNQGTMGESRAIADTVLCSTKK